jgi:hypothetical protein
MFEEQFGGLCAILSNNETLLLQGDYFRKVIFSKAPVLLMEYF